jgi:hypothetical protein
MTIRARIRRAAVRFQGRAISVIVLAIVASAAGLVEAVPSAQADQSFSYYLESFADSRCAYPTRTDPVGIIQFGSAARPQYVYGKDFTYHTGWRHWPIDELDAGETQWFWTGQCEPSDTPGDMASNSGITGDLICPIWECVHTIKRYHTRSNYDSGGPAIVMTPHYDVPCGQLHHRVTAAKASNNYVSGFDFARRQVVSDYQNHGAAHEHFIFRGTGNTALSKQCGGEWAGANGDVEYISYGR